MIRTERSAMRHRVHGPLAVGLAAVLVMSGCSSEKNLARENTPAGSSETVTTEDVSCLQEAAALTEEGATDLARESAIEVPESNLRYIATFLSEHPTASDVLDDTEGKGEARSAVANAIALLTSPSVAGGNDSRRLEDAIEPIDEGCTADLVEAPEAAGSIDALPETMAEVLREPALVLEQGESHLLKQRKTIPHLDELVAFANLMSSADNKYTNSEGVMPALLKQASGIAGDVRGSFGKNLTKGVDTSVSDAEVAESLGEILEGVGSNPSALWQVIKKDAENAGYTAEEGRSAMLTDSVMAPLLAFDWDESSEQQRPLIDLLSTVSDPELVFADDSDGGERGGIWDASRKSSEAGSYLGKLVGSMADELVDLPGRSGVSIGGTNPEVTDALARAIGPQLYGLAGGDDPDVEPYSGFRLDKETFMDMFEVLASSNEAMATTGTHVIDAQSLLFQSYGREHSGEIDKYVPPHKYIAIQKRLEDGVTAMARNSIATRVAEGREVDAWELMSYGIAYDPTRSFYYEVPARTNKGSGHEYIQPIPNPMLDFIVPRGDGETQYDAAQLAEKYEGDYEELAEDFEEKFVPLFWASDISLMSMFASLPPRAYEGLEIYDEALAEKLSDLTSVDVNGGGKYGTSDDVDGALSILLGGMERNFYMYYDYVDSDDSP